MRGIRIFITLVFACSQLFAIPAVSALEVEPTDASAGVETETEFTKVRPVITELQVADADEFVEIYNPSDEELELSGLLLRYRGGGANYVTLANLDTITMGPKQFMVFGHFAQPREYTVAFTNALNNSKGEVQIIDTAETSQLIDVVAWGDVSIESGYHYYVEPADIPPAGNSLQRCFVDNELWYPEERNTKYEFTVYVNDFPTPSLGIECPALESIEVAVDCSGVVINEIGANLDEQYIELYNSTNETLSIAGCLLQTNRNSNTYAFDEVNLGPGEYFEVNIADTNLTLTKTTTGTVYLLSSDGLVETDVQTYSDLDKETSWSRFDTGWLQTYELTPGTQNIDQEYPECDSGYYRNFETGRCNIEVVNVLVPCAIGQYRSLETNRCRNSIVPSTLKPCNIGQYRNPETNRCRNVATANVSFKPCAANQERNPATNRCRKKETGSIPDAAYKVQAVSDSDMVFTGWWALGGVGALAGGYAGWEWRREMANTWSRLIGIFKK